MRRVIQQSQFRRDYKRMRKRGKRIEKLEAVVSQLSEHGVLDLTYRPHTLTGEWVGYWECHISPDWLLIYDVNDEEVLLVRTGSHTDLFK